MIRGRSKAGRGVKGDRNMRTRIETQLTANAPYSANFFNCAEGFRISGLGDLRLTQRLS